MRLALSVDVAVKGRAGSSAPVSAITGLTIVGASPLLDKTNDYGDATARTGINCDGWVAKVTVPYLVGQTFDPTKISIVLSDPGYTAGGTTTVSRTVRGGVILRRQYNAQASPQSSNDGVTFTVYFMLTADSAGFATVFQGTTIVSATAAAGYYAASSAGSISSLTNSSTVAYPKPLFAWLQRQHTLTDSGGCYVEGVAYSWCGMNGQMVPRVEYIGKDSQGTPNVAATQTVSTPTISTLVTKGQPPECYAATIPVTALTQADLCFVNAKVYPWIGDSSAVLDLVASGVNVTGNWATANDLTPLRFKNNKTGGYGPAHASVKVGAIGGTVQATEVLSRVTPFPTVVGAMAAIQTYNNANKSHNDTGGGALWLMDDGLGGAVAHTIAAALNDQNAGNALTEIRQSPSNTATASIYVNVLVAQHPLISFHVDIQMDTAGWFRGFNTAVAYFCDGTLDQSASPPAPANYQTLAIAYNLTQARQGVFDLTSGEPGCKLIGCVNKVNSADIQTRAHTIIGCDFEHVVFSEIAAGTGSPSSQDGRVIANTKFMKMTGASGGCTFGNDIDYTKGAAVVQCITERSAGTTPNWSIGEQTTTAALSNILIICCTDVGDRTNIAYTTTAGTAGVIKEIRRRFNVAKERNTKGDTFGTVASTGNWRLRFDVDSFDFVLKGDNNNVTTPANNAWIGDFWNTPANTNLTIVATAFKLDASVSGTGAGGGDYRPTGAGNPLKLTALVPAGKSPLKYFLGGVARANDGTDAGGALQWAA